MSLLFNTDVSPFRLRQGIYKIKTWIKNTQFEKPRVGLEFTESYLYILKVKIRFRNTFKKARHTQLVKLKMKRLKIINESRW